MTFIKTCLHRLLRSIWKGQVSFNTFFLALCGGAEGVQNCAQFNNLRELRVSSTWLANGKKTYIVEYMTPYLRCSLSYQQAKWSILVRRQDVHGQILSKFQVKKILEGEGAGAGREKFLRKLYNMYFIDENESDITYPIFSCSIGRIRSW